MKPEPGVVKSLGYLSPSPSPADFLLPYLIAFEMSIFPFNRLSLLLRRGWGEDTQAGENGALSFGDVYKLRGTRPNMYIIQNMRQFYASYKKGRPSRRQPPASKAVGIVSKREHSSAI